MNRLVIRTVLPALLAIALFSGVVFFYFIPALSRAVMDQKRLMIRELTESSWNILARFEAEERTGRLTRAEAQRAAIEQVRSLHYGVEGKDYFWINDRQPRMIVHPYRPDLEGRDLSTFTDPQGKRLFVEMVQVVEGDGAGYVSYSWQWKDDPGRVTPKLSYVKGFAPWGWIIGTGVYIDDVQAEVATVTGQLRAAALLILAIVSLLLFVLLRTSFQAEQGRVRATAALRSSEERYRALVEAAGESIFMSLSEEGLFANASMLHLVGYDREELASLQVADLVRPTPAELEAGRRHWDAIVDGSAPPQRYEAELVHRSGRTVRVMLTLSRLVVEGRLGFMAVATQLAQPTRLDLEATETAEDLAAANRRMATLASLMIGHHADPMQVSRMLATNADRAVKRAVELAQEELGPAPVAFDLLLMGSLGRAEVSLLADQDHALIHAEVDDGDGAIAGYFLRLGARVSDILAAAGYAYCPGHIMSGEKACCQSLAAWERTFARWVHALEPEDLLHAKIFFDFRGTVGDGALVAALQAHLVRELEREPRFIPLLARSVLAYEPPLSPFGAFVLEAGDPVRATFDVKGVMAQIVDYVRLRSLAHGVLATNTLERLATLAEHGWLHADTARDLGAAFRFLMGVRLSHQARRILDQLEPDNRLAPDELDAATRRQLKTIFAQLKAVQTALEQELRGA